MEMVLKPEYELTSKDYQQIFQIRKDCFPENDVTNYYGKQLPTARILVYQKDQLIGHIGLMLRMIRINDSQFRTMGIQDVVVDPGQRGKGFMTQMIEKAEEIARKADCSLMILFAAEPEIYRQLGFENEIVEMEWLKIHEGRNLGTGLENVQETMIKFLTGDRPENITSIDMLGHIF